MSVIARERSILLLVDFQSRLMPAIGEGEALVRNARRLLDAAALFRIPVLFTEQNAEGLGGTLPDTSVRFRRDRAQDDLRRLPRARFP